MTTNQINLVILQGSDIVINQLKEALRNFNIVGSFQNLEDADIFLSTNTRIDVAIISTMLPTSSKEISNYSITQFIEDSLKKRPDLKILVYSARSYTQVILRHLLNLGIAGYLDKFDHLPVEEVAKAVDRILNNNIYLSPSPQQELER
ncbi:MAG: hypothetical protein AAF902_02375 [Chloroflexota bacterium]